MCQNIMSSDSCKVELEVDDKTKLNNTKPYVVNGTRVLTSCSSGWLVGGVGRRGEEEGRRRGDRGRE